MEFLNKILKSKKIRFFTAIAAVTAIAVAAYFYFPNFFPTQPQQVTTTFQFSRPDNRPDEIKGEIVTLKRLHPEYFMVYHKMISPTVRKPLYWPAHGSFSWTKKQLTKELKKEAAGLTFLYTIFDNNDDKLIGALGIREKNPKDPGQFYCWLNENYWGGGRIREAIKLVTREYFKIKKVPSFTAHVEMWNLRSYYALKKAEFKLVDFYYENGEKTRYILEFYNPGKSYEK